MMPYELSVLISSKKRRYTDLEVAFSGTIHCFLVRLSKYQTSMKPSNSIATYIFWASLNVILGAGTSEYGNPFLVAQTSDKPGVSWRKGSQLPSFALVNAPHID